MMSSRSHLLYALEEPGKFCKWQMHFRQESDVDREPESTPLLGRETHT